MNRERASERINRRPEALLQADDREAASGAC